MSMMSLSEGIAFDAGAFVVSVLIMVAVALAVLIGRRWWLRRRWATFECSLRGETRSHGRGWALGVGAYGDGVLRWYKLLSLRMHPRLTLDRQQLEILTHRRPTGVEARSIVPGHVIVTVSDSTTVIELAMRPDAVTSFTAWLETATRV